MMAEWGSLLVTLDKICLAIFLVEIGIKLAAYRGRFWRSGWNVFDVLVVAIALVPGAGPWAVLRSLRVLRVLRLLTVIPSLRKVVAAFLHSIPGLAGVVAVGNRKFAPAEFFLSASAGLRCLVCDDHR
jgi:voltage-gated sodium channel